MNTQVRRKRTEQLVLAALMTALVIVFQLLGEFAKFFGPFATALALIPIIIGACICGVKIGTWLGFVFGVVVLLCPSTQLFYGSGVVVGTIVTVLTKGMLCGFAAGIVYKLLKKCNIWVRAVAAAIICPVINTSIFLLGCYLFFLPKAAYFIEKLSLSGVNGMAVFWGMATAYFVFEIGTSVVLCPAIVRILNLKNLNKT